MPVLHIDDQPGIVQHAGVSSLEPVIPPADSFSAPLDLGAGDGVMRKGVVPRSDNRLQRGLRLLQHVGDAVAIAVEQAADNKARNLDLAVGAHRASPERAVMLVFEIKQRPGRSVEARAQNFFVERVIGSAGHAGRHVHVQLELIDVRHAVHVVHIVVKEFGGSGHRNDGLKFRCVPHGHLQRIESAPGDAHHANVSVRPRLMRQPGDDLQAVELLLLRVFAAGGNAFAGAEAADIDAGAHVSAAHEVGVQFVVPLGGAVVLAIRVILEDRREISRRPCRHRACTT